MRKWNFQAKGDRAATVRIYDEVGAGFFGGLTAKAFAEELDDLGAIDELSVRINSPGGSVFEGLAIYNTLLSHPAKVTVDIDGLAASIASIIAMAGDEVRMAKSAKMMIHNPWTIAIGDAAEMRKAADQLDGSRDSLLDIYAGRSSKSRAELLAMMDDETWFGADAAKSAGLADTVIEGDMAIAALARGFDLSRFRHPPADLKDPGPRGEMRGAVEASDAAQEVAVRLRLVDLQERSR